MDHFPHPLLTDVSSELSQVSHHLHASNPTPKSLLRILTLACFVADLVHCFSPPGEPELKEVVHAESACFLGQTSQPDSLSREGRGGVTANDND